MLIDEIAREQSSHTAEPTPPNNQWHNMHRKDDKMAQDHLDALQHQFIQAVKVAQAITPTREFMAKQKAIQHWATALPGSAWRIDEQPHISHNHRKAVNIISSAYRLIQTTPRKGDQHHVTVTGNNIQEIAMASDDPLVAPDEHDLAFFNLCECLEIWHLNALTQCAALTRTTGNVNVVQLASRPSAINIKTELPAFITFTNEAVSLVTAADTLSDVSLIDESLTRPEWHRSPVSPITVKGVAGSTEQLRHTVTVPVCLRWGASRRQTPARSALGQSRILI
jgi:hypothetical protein